MVVWSLWKTDWDFSENNPVQSAAVQFNLTYFALLLLEGGKKDIFCSSSVGKVHALWVSGQYKNCASSPYRIKLTVSKGARQLGKKLYLNGNKKESLYHLLCISNVGSLRLEIEKSLRLLFI